MTVALIASFIGLLILSVVVMQFLIARTTRAEDKDLIYLVTEEKSGFGKSESKTVLYVGIEEKVAFGMNPRETDEGANSLTLQVWFQGEHLITYNNAEQEWQPVCGSPEELDVRPMNAF
ncbi:hypothetical protein [Paenibacillus glucanolyticus]|uniref:hypothetical protein n=1 Tax=Paenibacillus glucanolyticus TaxID=59843 RepID=UPI00096CB5EF|nr:hypothetical protein [Paenibacillus glucanolyticus]OMF76769.1 hypothetical protein BK142_14720 [Paenibacillus glucanolyticus]